ncbi:hypothetical protein DXG01_007810 [Tephrocybe rancida]|nr:hypothetical protein DXG01_007810 [Tephrocybe rancida]
MRSLSPQANTSPNRYRAFNSSSMPRTNNPYHRNIYSPGVVSPIRQVNLSPNTTPSPKRKARSSASTSLFTSFVRALKINPKGKKRVQKLASPLTVSPIQNEYGKRRLQRVRSVPVTAKWDSYSPPKSRNAVVSNSGDGMDVDGGNVEGRTSPAQYLYYEGHEDPFATPPCTPLTPLLSNGLNSIGTPESSPDSVRNRKRRAVERSRMKSLHLLGPEARLAVGERFGNAKRAWEV